MKRLKNFDEYWKTAKEPSAFHAFEVQMEVIEDLRKDLATALKQLRRSSTTAESRGLYVMLSAKWEINGYECKEKEDITEAEKAKYKPDRDR